jgi:NAD(P)H-dependent FMN reductase
MIHTKRVLVIVASVRGRRIGHRIAEWAAGIARETVAAAFEIVDLKGWPLPPGEEPGLPALGNYVTDSTRAWSKKIAGADGFIFVTPQYNWGYPAPLKNALDHLYKEWHGKPAVIVTYGARGGGKCAGQLRQVLRGLDMKPVATMPGLRRARSMIEADTGVVDPPAEFARSLRKLHRALKELTAALEGRRRRFGLF